MKESQECLLKASLSSLFLQGAAGEAPSAVQVEWVWSLDCLLIFAQIQTLLKGEGKGYAVIVVACP